eukprot:952072-Rhodomonas_salina.1
MRARSRHLEWRDGERAAERACGVGLTVARGPGCGSESLASTRPGDSGCGPGRAGNLKPCHVTAV